MCLTGVLGCVRVPGLVGLLVFLFVYTRLAEGVKGSVQKIIDATPHRHSRRKHSCTKSVYHIYTASTMRPPPSNLIIPFTPQPTPQHSQPADQIPKHENAQ